jgi:hypothetical protein
LFTVLEWAEKGQAMKMDERETMTPLDEENAWKYFRDLINGLDYRAYTYFNICISTAI